LPIGDLTLLRIPGQISRIVIRGMRYREGGETDD
jgi:hypothetical protein